MTKYAIVNAERIITEVGERADLESRTGWDRELVELVQKHRAGDRIEYGADGVELDGDGTAEVDYPRD